MRVLHLADRLTDRGGAYWHLAGILDHQLREHEVRLAVGRDDGSLHVPIEVRILAGLDARLRQPVKVEALVSEIRPDVVHLHNVVNPDVLERVGKLTGVTRVVAVQDHRFFCPAQGKWTASGVPCAEPMSRALCRDCFTDERYFEEVYAVTAERLEALSGFDVVVLSQYMKKELVAAGLASERIDVIPPFVHGLDLDAAANGPPLILFAGRLVEAKGVRDAVAAWKRCGVDLPLAIAGTGSLREELEQEGIELLGWVPHQEMASLYRRAKALLVPSRWQEPFGIAGLEALTMGTPVVAWESGGVSEWHSGPLAAWGDVEGLVRELSAAIGRTGRPKPGFDREASMARLEALYRKRPR